MLENNKIRVNTDLRQRFIPRRTIHIEGEASREEDVWRADKITKGDYVILSENMTVLFGRALNFMRLGKQSKKDSTFYQNFVETESSDNIGLLLNPLFSVKDGRKTVINNIKYYEIKSYKCHAKIDVDFSQESIINFITN